MAKAKRRGKKKARVERKKAKRNMSGRKVDWKVLAASFAIVVMVAAAGSVFTSNGISSGWYESIKPALAPPNFVFPVVWSTLFFLIAISLYLSWAAGKERQKVALAFGANFALNVSWSWLYFGMRSPALAFIEIIPLWASIALMIFVSWGISRKAAWLLVPYLVWVSFAAVLNYMTI